MAVMDRDGLSGEESLRNLGTKLFDAFVPECVQRAYHQILLHVPARDCAVRRNSTCIDLLIWATWCYNFGKALYWSLSEKVEKGSSC